MSNQIPALFAFNRGIVSEFALARVDQKRLAFSAQTMNNVMARVLGPMSLRPGTGYKGASFNNRTARNLKFIFSTSDTSIVELTDQIMRVWINDVLLTRPAVTAPVTNGTFSGSVAGWTDGSDAGGAISWAAGNLLQLVGNGTARAIAYQAVATANTGTEHALRITIARGPVTLRVGSSNGDDDYVSETSLATGDHSIAFTPSGTFYIQFSSTTVYKKLVSQCTTESSGVVTIPTPWLAAHLGKVRYDQSGDILFCSCDGYQQRKIERRGTRPGARSWSNCVYETNDGPFMVENIGPNQLKCAATTGDTTCTALQPYFKSTQVGGLLSITTSGQTQTKAIAAENTFTNSIKVTGISRSFGITITGSLAAGSTVQLQRSSDNSTWADVAGQSWVSAAMPVSTSFDDGLTNQLLWYRIGIKTGAYTAPDNVTCTLIFSQGSQRGIVRITGFTSSTVVDCQVLSDLGGTAYTDIWQEGMWSTRRGFPTCVRLHEGRLWWFGRNGIWGSVSDGFTSFDETIIGNSGPINRTIGSGPVDVINWALSLQRLLVGAEGKEVSVRSSALDTPLTPTDFNMKDASTQGSAAVEAWKIDQKGIYVQRNGIKVYELTFDVQTYDYNSADLMEMCPEIGIAGIVRMDIQRQPDTRFHCVLADGTVVIAVYSKQEDVLAWQTYSTDGYVEDVVTLPAVINTTEDQVYYLVRRTINGATVRYLEKWAFETDCRGGTTNKNIDSHIVVTNSPASATVAGLSHLIGASVVVWADGAPLLDANDDPQTFTVNASGQITLPAAASSVTVGLYYEGLWKSTKLGQMQSALFSLFSHHRRVQKIGFLLAYFCRAGFKFGPDFTHMDDMPGIEDGTTAPSFETAYENDLIPFPCTWTPDLRLCIKMKAPMPCTVLGVPVDIEVAS